MTQYAWRGDPRRTRYHWFTMRCGCVVMYWPGRQMRPGPCECERKRARLAGGRVMRVSLKHGLEQASREIAESPEWLRAIREQNRRLLNRVRPAKDREAVSEREGE